MLRGAVAAAWLPPGGKGAIDRCGKTRRARPCSFVILERDCMKYYKEPTDLKYSMPPTALLYCAPACTAGCTEGVCRALPRAAPIRTEETSASDKLPSTPGRRVLIAEPATHTAQVWLAFVCEERFCLAGMPGFCRSRTATSKSPMVSRDSSPTADRLATPCRAADRRTCSHSIAIASCAGCAKHRIAAMRCFAVRECGALWLGWTRPTDHRCSRQGREHLLCGDGDTTAAAFLVQGGECG